MVKNEKTHNGEIFAMELWAIISKKFRPKHENMNIHAKEIPQELRFEEKSTLPHNNQELNEEKSLKSIPQRNSWKTINYCWGCKSCYGKWRFVKERICLIARWDQII